MNSVKEVHGTSWADYDQDNEDESLDNSSGLITIDKDGFRLITSYFRNAEGRQMKSQRKLKVTKKIKRVPLAVKERQANWKPFGVESAEYIEKHNLRKLRVPTPQDEILKAPRQIDGAPQNDNDEDFSSLITTGADGPGFKRQLAEIHRYFNAINDPDPHAIVTLKEREEMSAMAQPILMGLSDKPQYNRSPDTDDRTLRVSNLPEYTTDDELHTLFSRIGPVMRCHIARNKETNSSRGYGFVTYKTRAEAEMAVDKLHKKGFQNVLLNIEWSKRRD